MHQYTYYRRYRPQQRRRKGGNFKPFFVFVLILVALVFLLKACVNVVSSVREDKRDDLVLSVNRGTAEVLAAGSVRQEAAQSQLMFEGDTVITADDSYVTLSFQNGGRVVLDENTEVNFAEYQWNDGSEFFQFDLLTGRVWVEQLPSESSEESTLMFRTDVINSQSYAGEYLVTNLANAEGVASLTADVDLAFVDRAGKEVVIESVSLRSEQISVLSSDEQNLLLARENVVLSEEWDLLTLANDSFVQWVRGEIEIALEEEEAEEEEASEEEPVEETEEVVEEEPEEVVEETVEEPEEPEAESLRISVTSPSSPITLSEAIAIEGVVSSGTASRVIVTWSGNGAPYQLGLFSTGDESFRYVADPNYLNMNEGLNTYTVVAYGPDGEVSNTVVLEVTLDSTQEEASE